MRKISLFFICTIFYLSTTAQTGHFIMSSVGVLPGTESNGVAIQFSSITKCIDVQSGLAGQCLVILKNAKSNDIFLHNVDFLVLHMLFDFLQLNN
jgi:hypothetical protein